MAQASAIASLEQIAPGRLMVGFGTGSLALIVYARLGPSKLPFGVLTLALEIVVRRSSMLRP